jgi:uncharacterized membrane protein
LLEPWEIHPAAAHFPLALLLSAVVLDFYAWWRDQRHFLRPIAGLLVTGVLTGIIAAASGLVAFFTVPAHTAEAHTLLYWHLGVMATALALFVWPAWLRWRAGVNPPSHALRWVGIVGALLIAVGGALGGQIVYRGGAGVDPKILSPELRESHSHLDASPTSQPHH